MTRTGLTAREAALAIHARIVRQPAVTVPLDEALGLVLAADAVAPLALPAHANSAMDGYACRADDVRGASAATPVTLRVVETVPAGRFPTRALGPGECTRLFTGAPVPEGADSVVRQEDTDEGTAQVEIRSARDAGHNVRPAGEDLAKGSIAVPAGTVLGPAHLGVLASIAEARPHVFRRPRVGLLGSGDELADVHDRAAILSGRRTASSNSHTLAALVREAGGVPVPLGTAADTPASVREHLARADGCDLLVTSAGISVGAHDHLRGVLADLGCTPDFWRLRMRPGAPVGFGLLDGMPWIGLPGNPVSAMVTFELFVRPAIRAALGDPRPFRAATPVRLAAPVKVAATLQHFLRVTLEDDGDGPPLARLTGGQGSGLLTSMARADALLVVPEGQLETPAGTLLPALRLDEPRRRAAPAF